MLPFPVGALPIVPEVKRLCELRLLVVLGVWLVAPVRCRPRLLCRLLLRHLWRCQPLLPVRVLLWRVVPQSLPLYLPQSRSLSLMLSLILLHHQWT